MKPKTADPAIEQANPVYTPPLSSKPGDIVMIALEISKDGKNKSFLDDFQKLSAFEQVNWLKTRIESLCQQLAENNSDKMWIVAWREYGLTDYGLRFLAPDAYDYFQKTMQDLTTKYHNLVVLGPVSTYENIASLRGLKEVQDIYQNGTLVNYVKIQEAVEASQMNSDMDEQVRKHEAQTEKLQNDGGPIYACTNQILCFQGAHMFRHDKVAPIDELTDDHPLRDRMVFQPGSQAYENPFFEVSHPITDEVVLLGAETCRENNFNLLVKALPDKQPYIHCIFSDEVKLSLETMHGLYNVQLDSLVKPRLIIPSENNTASVVMLYRNNLLMKDASLVGPVEPLHPFERRVEDALNMAIQSFPPKHPKQDLLKIMLTNFTDLSVVYDVNVLYQTLLNDIRKYEQELCKPEDTSRNLFHTYLSRFSILRPATPSIAENMRGFLDSLKTMVQEERKKYSGFKDICSYQDPPVMERKQGLSPGR